VTRRLVIAMAVLVAVVAAALAVPMAAVVANDQRSAFVAGLEVDTLTTAAIMSAQPDVDWQQTAEATAARTGARVVVVAPDRSLLGDSDNSSLDRLFDRPEINDALAGSLTSDVRTSVTLGEDLRYVAAPVIQNYGVVAAVRLSLPESIVEEEVQETQRWLVVFVLTVVVAAALVAWLLARSISSPLRQVAKVAEDLPDDLDLRANEDDGPHEVRAVAAALNSTAQRLSGILQRQQRVAADASHHLRTPLTGVRLRLEAIEDISDQDQVKTEAHAATAEVDRLTRRIEQVLALARSDAGAAPIAAQDESVILRDRIEAASAMFVEAGVELTASLEPGVLVTAPTGVMARVVDELLGNALQYAKTRVHVDLRAIDRTAVLSVSDDGPGVPADEREAVFDRFTRGTTSVPGGSGLGLALVRESVAGLGGSARAGESQWGGLTVTVRMPMADEPVMRLPRTEDS
jgi:signal transduction histidine kinase